VKVIENITIRWSEYDFLLTFYSKYGSNSSVSEIPMSKNIATLKSRSGSIKIIESGTIRYTGYGFLFVFYCNFVPKIFDFKNVVTLKTGLEVRQGH